MKKSIWLVLSLCMVGLLCGCQMRENQFPAIIANFKKPQVEEPETTEATTEETTTEEQKTEDTPPPPVENPTNHNQPKQTNPTSKKTKKSKKSDQKSPGDNGTDKPSSNKPSEETTTEETTEAALVSIAYEGTFQNRYYTEDEAVFSKKEVVATYADGSKKSISFSKCKLSGFDTSSVGNKTLTITYQTASITLDYEVEDGNIVQELKVSGSIPVVPKGGDIDTSDIEVKATMNSGRTKKIPLSDCEVSGFSSSSAGTKDLTISYKGKSDTISYSVKVFSIRYEYIYETYVGDSKTSSVKSGTKIHEVNRKTFSSKSDIVGELSLNDKGADETVITSDSAGKNKVSFPIKISDSERSVTIYIHFITYNEEND